MPHRVAEPVEVDELRYRRNGKWSDWGLLARRRPAGMSHAIGVPMSSQGLPRAVERGFRGQEASTIVSR